MIATAERYTIKGFEAPRPITSEAQNEYYTTVLHDLVMRGHLNRREEEYVELLSLLIEAYEEEHYPIRDASPIEVIKELMAANDLPQRDLVRIAQQMLAKLEQISKTHYVPALYFAATYTGLGDNEQTFSWLEKAFKERDDRLVHLGVDPIADPLRSDPRFQQLMKRSGLK